MVLNLRVLGSSSALPLSNRFPSAQFLTIANRHFLIDCGEGTQMQLRRNRIGFGRINHIFISHLHGDHFYGLLPLLTSLHLLDRHKELHLYGPPALEQGVYDLLKLSGARLRYPLTFHALDMQQRQRVYDDKAVSVFSFPLKHSLPCCGFLFQEKPRPRNMRKDMIEKHKIPVAEIRQIKGGANWEDEEGNSISNAELTTPPAPPLSYAYCTDTLPMSELASLLQCKPSLLYHEATFTEEHRERARKTKHSTALQAAKVARSVEAGHLLLGHFSIRYKERDTLLQEARNLFPNSWLAEENSDFSLKEPEKLLHQKPAN
ncbi:MAG: ribonuclease Z [Owenweeksia sp.]|nr:ribonuclease Z [Owenweeksia sp.]